MFQSFVVLTLFLWHYKNSFVPFSCLYCAKAWVISFNSIWFWLWLCDEVLYLELLCDPSFDTFGQTWAHMYIGEKWMMQSGIVQSQRPSIMRAGSQCFYQPLTLSRQQHLMRYLIILNDYFLLEAHPAPVLWSYELNFYRPTVASDALRGHLFFSFFLSKVCFGRNVCANDVNFKLFTQ